MQLNLFVPKARQNILHDLDDAARMHGISKNTLVLDAIEQYLERLNSEAAPAPTLHTYRLGIQPWTREDLYDERTEQLLR